MSICSFCQSSKEAQWSKGVEQGVVSVLRPFGAAQYLHFTRNKMVPAGAGSSEANKICFDVSLTLSLILHKRTDDRANKTGE